MFEKEGEPVRFVDQSLLEDFEHSRDEHLILTVGVTLLRLLAVRKHNVTEETMFAAGRGGACRERERDTVRKQTGQLHVAMKKDVEDGVIITPPPPTPRRAPITGYISRHWSSDASSEVNPVNEPSRTDLAILFL